MPSYYVRNDQVQNGLGYALPNVAVTYYAQPSGALASVFSGPNGGAAENPQTTNGLGQATAYLAEGQYTITYSGAQIQTQTFADQNVGPTGGGSGTSPFAGTPSGTQDGVNRVFTLTNAGTALSGTPEEATVLGWVNIPLVNGVGFTISGTSIIYTNAPQSGDSIYAQGFYA